MAISVPNITPTEPRRIPKMLFVPISIHLIPSATRKAKTFSLAWAG